MKVQEDSNFDLEKSCWQRATLLTKQFLHEVMSPNHENEVASMWLHFLANECWSQFNNILLLVLY